MTFLRSVLRFLLSLRLVLPLSPEEVEEQGRLDYDRNQHPPEPCLLERRYLLWRWQSQYAQRVVNVLKSFTEKWEDLTHFYDHPEIPRTSNDVERLFSRTNPERVKRRFRTRAGIMSHLSSKHAARRGIQALLAV